MGEGSLVVIGVLLLIAALAKASLPTLGWILLRLRLSRLITLALALLLIAYLATRLTDPAD